MIDLSKNPYIPLDAFRNYMSGGNRQLVLTEGYMSDWQPLSAGTASLNTQTITFSMTKTGNGDGPSMANRLNIDDAFCAISLGMFLGITPTTGGAISTAIQQQQNIPMSFPQAGNLQAADVLPAQELYNGYISIVEGSTTWFKAIEAYGYYRVGTQQAGLIFATGGTVGNRSDWSDVGYGFVKLDPNMVFAGDRTYTVNLNLRAGATFGALSGTNGQLWVGLRAFGFTAAGGAKFVRGLNS